jgi:Protein kinase domain/AAA ATPase domain
LVSELHGARYTNITPIRRGGMGAVYKAFDNVRGHLVAIKRLHLQADAYGDERTALFHLEYRTLAELAHPCVIEVYDYGVDAEGPFYTMELLDGSDLPANAPMRWQDACSVLRDVSSSLALLHSRSYVHRDVSPLNVRCTSRGRAKLIDFGAMMPMGMSALIVGTPPYIAPEVVLKRPLDARTDLFSLGATLYFALTGTHAFPARTLRQLRTLHAALPAPPSTLAPDTPAALDRLVMSLLSVDPEARPGSASEVMERLTVIAELPAFEQAAVQKAYLKTPALVGRSRELAQLAHAVKRVHSADHTVVRISAPAGGGRTRMLQSTAMEARLAGLNVVMAGAREGSRQAPYSVLRQVIAQLQDSAPEARAAIAQYDVFAAVLRGDAREEDRTLRARILAGFCALVLRVAETHPTLITLDDIERCDEPSLAALLTLAAAHVRGRFGIVYTAAGDPRDRTGALDLLLELSTDVALPPLTELDTEALLRSVFGELASLPTLARYVFERSAGNPRAAMELAQALVDRGLARYELGSWTIPARIASDALPASYLVVRKAAIEALSSDARELAEIMAITDGYALGDDDLIPLTSHRDRTRFEATRRELGDARVLVRGDLQRFADRGWLDVVRQGAGVDAQRAIYQRLSELLQARELSPIIVARCLLKAGAESRALDVLCGALGRGTLIGHADPEYPELLADALRCSRELERPARDAFFIQRELAGLADRVIINGLANHFRELLARLRIDSGLADWHALESQPASERLPLALRAAQTRYDAADERARVLNPIEAITCLAETVYGASVYAALFGDSALLNGLPSLEPFEPLSPAIHAVDIALQAQKALNGARYEDALELYEARLVLLDTPGSGLTESQIARSRLLVHYALGALKAGLGIEGALDHAAALDSLRDGQIFAAALRENYFLRRGNARAAQQARRSRELLQIQQKRAHALSLRQTTQQLEGAAQIDDLAQTKRHLDVLQELAAVYECAMPYVHYARAEYERIRGDFTAALKHVACSLAASAAGVDAVWPWAAACEIECLRQLGRLEQARQLGLERVHVANAVGLRIMRDHIECFLALVEGQLGLFEPAQERLDRGIAYREQYGMLGVNLGWEYEARARLALWMKDRAVFERSMRRSLESYEGERDNPALAARHEQLLRDARAIWESLDVNGAFGTLPPTEVEKPPV